MATSDESQQPTGAHPHVVKKADVHVRRNTPSLRERLKPSKNAEGDGRNAPVKSPNDSDAGAAAEATAAQADPSQHNDSSASERELPARENSDGEKDVAPSKRPTRRTVRKAPSATEASELPESSKSLESPQEPGSSESSELPESPQAPESPESTESADVEEPSSEPPKKKRIWLRVVIIVMSVLIVMALVVAGLFAWNRWWRYDDARDMQGTWYAAGTTVPVHITDTAIALNEETSYLYEIDPQAKTISYYLANMKGEGRYWFENDRQALVIVDGKGFTSTDTAIDDFGRSLSSFFVTVTGGQVALPQGEGIIALTREPDAAALAAERAAEEAAAKEEAARRHAEAEAAMAEVAAAREAAEAEEAPAEEAPAEEAPEEGDSNGESEQEPSKQEFANESIGVFD